MTYAANTTSRKYPLAEGYEMMAKDCLVAIRIETTNLLAPSLKLSEAGANACQMFWNALLVSSKGPADVVEIARKKSEAELALEFGNYKILVASQGQPTHDFDVTLLWLSDGSQKVWLRRKDDDFTVQEFRGDTIFKRYEKHFDKLLESKHFKEIDVSCCYDIETHPEIPAG